MIDAASPLIALTGNPNAGKTSLFNALTGLQQKIGNFPGVTVEKKLGLIKLANGQNYQLVDLPGIYSLHPTSIDEQIALDVLLNEGTHGLGIKPHIIVAVADAVNLERTLGLVIDLKHLDLPVICALNMMDIAQKRGLKIDMKRLSEDLKCPVVPTVAKNKKGVATLLRTIENCLAAHNTPSWLNRPKTLAALISGRSSLKFMSAEERFKKIDQVLENAVRGISRQPDAFSQKLDKVLLHPLWGTLIMFASLLFMFQGVFTWTKPISNLINDFFAWSASNGRPLVPFSLLQSLVFDGVFSGISAILVFIPQILFLFFFIYVLEGCGYMMRMAFLLDRLMQKVGLQGQSFVPLLSSFACAIPGMMATRSIKDPQNRLVTILISPLITCSARLPVYALLIGAFIPNQTVIPHLLNLQGLVMFSLFLIGLFSALVVAWVLKKVLKKTPSSPFIMELPSYKWPHWPYIAHSLWTKTVTFLKKAGTTILAVSVILWALTSFPKPPKDFTGSPIEYSYAARVGKLLEPATHPLGFNWEINTGLIAGFAAREVMVSALSTVFAVESSQTEEPTSNLAKKIQLKWELPTALALIAWYIFAPQCMATLATIRKETYSRAWPVATFFVLFAIAFLAAWTTYHVSTLLL